MGRGQWIAGGTLALLVVLAWALSTDRWQAAGAVATAEASIVALISAMWAIDLERKKQEQERKDREDQVSATRAVARAMLLSDLQDLMAAAFRLTDQLPGFFEGQIDGVERTAQEILDHRYAELRFALEQIKNPISAPHAPLLQSLPLKDLTALREIMLLIGDIQRAPVEIDRRMRSRSGIAMTSVELINDLNRDNARLIAALQALRDSWQPNLATREMRRVV